MAVDGISDRSERERRKPALSLSGNIGLRAPSQDRPGHIHRLDRHRRRLPGCTDTLQSKKAVTCGFGPVLVTAHIRFGTIGRLALWCIGRMELRLRWRVCGWRSGCSRAVRRRLGWRVADEVAERSIACSDQAYAVGSQPVTESRGVEVLAGAVAREEPRALAVVAGPQVRSVREVFFQERGKWIRHRCGFFSQRGHEFTGEPVTSVVRSAATLTRG